VGNKNNTNIFTYVPLMIYPVVSCANIGTV